MTNPISHNSQIKFSIGPTELVPKDQNEPLTTVVLHSETKGFFLKVLSKEEIENSPLTKLEFEKRLFYKTSSSINKTLETDYEVLSLQLSTLITNHPISQTMNTIFCAVNGYIESMSCTTKGEEFQPDSIQFTFQNISSSENDTESSEFFIDDEQLEIDQGIDYESAFQEPFGEIPFVQEERLFDEYYKILSNLYKNCDDEPSSEHQEILKQYPFKIISVLDLENLGLPEKGIYELINTAKGAQTLEFNHTSTFDPEKIKDNLNIKEIDMRWNAKVTNYDFHDLLSRCKGLEVVDISELEETKHDAILHSNDVNIIDLAGVKIPNTVKTLDLGGNRRVTNKTFMESTRDAVNLEMINVSDTLIGNFTDEDGIHEFKELKIFQAVFCKNLTNRDIQFLAKSSEKIEEFNLCATQVSLEGVTFSENLKVLDLGGNRAVKSIYLKSALKNCPNLQKIVITGTYLSENDFEYLSSVEIIQE